MKQFDPLAIGVATPGRRAVDHHFVDLHLGGSVDEHGVGGTRGGPQGSDPVARSDHRGDVGVTHAGRAGVVGAGDEVTVRVDEEGRFAAGRVVEQAVGARSVDGHHAEDTCLDEHALGGADQVCGVDLQRIAGAVLHGPVGEVDGRAAGVLDLQPFTAGVGVVVVRRPGVGEQLGDAQVAGRPRRSCAAAAVRLSRGEAIRFDPVRGRVARLLDACLTFRGI